MNLFLNYFHAPEDRCESGAWIPQFDWLNVIPRAKQNDEVIGYPAELRLTPTSVNKKTPMYYYTEVFKL